MIDDISHEGPPGPPPRGGRVVSSDQDLEASNDPDFEAKKNRILELYAIADGTAEPGEGDPTVVICMDEFGPLNLQPHPGKQWAPVGSAGGGETKDPAGVDAAPPTPARTGSAT